MTINIIVTTNEQAVYCLLHNKRADIVTVTYQDNQDLCRVAILPEYIQRAKELLGEALEWNMSNSSFLYVFISYRWSYVFDIIAQKVGGSEAIWVQSV